MKQQIDYSKCRHFDTPRCPNQKHELMEKAAFDIPEYKGGKMQDMPIVDYDEVRKICDKYELN